MTAYEMRISDWSSDVCSSDLDEGAGAGRDEAADDDVLLEADQAVFLAVGGRLGEHPGGLLEGGRRDEGARLQARLGDALQHRPRHGRAAALGDHLVVDLLELVAVDLLADQESRQIGRASCRERVCQYV